MRCSTCLPLNVRRHSQKTRKQLFHHSALVAFVFCFFCTMSGWNTRSSEYDASAAPPSYSPQDRYMHQSFQQQQPRGGSSGYQTGGYGGQLPASANIICDGPPLGGAEANPHLYVHNVPKDSHEEELRQIFGRYGTVEGVRLKVNQKVGPHAVYAFVTFSSTEEAEVALSNLQGADIRKRSVSTSTFLRFNLRHNYLNRWTSTSNRVSADQVKHTASSVAEQQQTISSRRFTSL